MVTRRLVGKRDKRDPALQTAGSVATARKRMEDREEHGKYPPGLGGGDKGTPEEDADDEMRRLEGIVYVERLEQCYECMNWLRLEETHAASSRECTRQR